MSPGDGPSNIYIHSFFFELYNNYENEKYCFALQQSEASRAIIPIIPTSYFQNKHRSTSAAATFELAAKLEEHPEVSRLCPMIVSLQTFLWGQTDVVYWICSHQSNRSNVGPGRSFLWFESKGSWHGSLEQENLESF